jgi:hypothetical protein
VACNSPDGGPDPILLLAALLRAVAGGADGEHGAVAWRGLAALADQADAPNASRPAELAALRSAPQAWAPAKALARVFLAREAVDSEFRRDLRRWRRGLGGLEDWARASVAPTSPAGDPPAGPRTGHARRPAGRRWLLAGLLAAAVFSAATWISGALVLPLVLASSADRWVIASALGVAVAAVVAVWSPSWAGPLGSEEPTGTGTGTPLHLEGVGITAGNDQIVSVGGNVVNIHIKNSILVAIVVVALVVASVLLVTRPGSAPAGNIGAGNLASGSRLASPAAAARDEKDAAAAGPVQASAYWCCRLSEDKAHDYYWPRSPAAFIAAARWRPGTPRILATLPGTVPVTPSVEISIQTSSDDEILIAGLRVVMRSRHPSDPRAGLVVEQGCGGCGGASSARYFDTDLDSAAPVVKSEGARATYYHISKDDSEVFVLNFADATYDCVFDLELDWVAHGKNGETLLDNNGKHFHIAGSSGHPWYREFDPGNGPVYLVSSPQSGLRLQHPVPGR